jgi:hypothetical protein
MFLHALSSKNLRKKRPWWDNTNRRIPVSHMYPLGDWTQVPHKGKQTGGPLDQWNCVWMQGDCRLSTGLPPSSPPRRLWSQKKDLQQAWNRDSRAVWDQVGLSYCRHDSLVTVRDEARLGQGHNDQSHWGHHCSETMLTGESQFHISTPLGIEPRSLIKGSKRVDHWTSRTVYECSGIAGSPQGNPPAADYVGCEAGRRTCSGRETGTE